MRAAIDEDEFTKACPALTFAAVVTLRSMAPFGRDVGGPEPAAKSLRVDLDLVLFFQGFGKMVVVVLPEQGPTQLQDTLTQIDGFGVGGSAATVAMNDPAGSLSTHTGFEPEDLTDGKPEHRGCVTGRPTREHRLDYPQPHQLTLLKQQL